MEDHMRRQDRKKNVDKVAAALILQEWLDARRTTDANEPQQNEKEGENEHE